MSKETEEIREPFEVDESSFNFLDVNAESNEPQEESSASVESVELTDAEGEGETTDSEPVEEEKNEEIEPETETEEVEESEKVEEPDESLKVAKDGKIYDFSSAPKEMREVLKTNNELVNAFVRDNMDAVQTKLQELSPSSYANLERTIVQRSAEANPDKWAEYLVKTKPETVKEALLGADLKGVNLDVISELARIYQEESDEGEELRMTLELRNPDFAANAVPKLEPAEKAELEEYRRKERESKQTDTTSQTQKTYEEVFDYIDTETVLPIVKQFGLMPEATDTPEITEGKRNVVNALAGIVVSRLESDPETKDDYQALMKKIDANDAKGAMAILPSIQAKIEEISINYFSFIKNQQTASLKQKHTPAKKPPTALAVGQTVKEAPKPLTLAQRLEQASDEEILRNMGI